LGTPPIPEKPSNFWTISPSHADGGPGSCEREEPIMKDADLIALLTSAASALDEEMAWLVDVDVDDRGRSTPSISVDDRPYYEALEEHAQALRELVETIRDRSRSNRQPV